MGPVLTKEITYIEIMYGYGRFEPMDPNGVTQSAFGKFFLCFSIYGGVPYPLEGHTKEPSFKRTTHPEPNYLFIHS